MPSSFLDSILSFDGSPLLQMAMSGKYPGGISESVSSDCSTAASVGVSPASTAASPRAMRGYSKPMVIVDTVCAANCAAPTTVVVDLRRGAGISGRARRPSRSASPLH